MYTRMAGPSTLGLTGAGTAPHTTPPLPAQLKLNVFGFEPVFCTSNQAEYPPVFSGRVGSPQPSGVTATPYGGLTVTTYDPWSELVLPCAVSTMLPVPAP